MSDQTTLAFPIPEPAPNCSVDLRHGDCLTVLRDLPDNSVDSVVTDPPYGLSNTKPAQVADVLAAWVTGDTEAVPAKKGGFMGADWDSFVPPPAVWQECLRVLKPGGHMAVFAGARTQDLMGLSIRLAGFEIRDTLGWVYGSGFPKSMDVSKAIDKTGGVSPEVQALTLKNARERAGLTREQVAERVGCSASSVGNWEDGRARAKGSPIEFITPGPEYRDALANLLGYSEDERMIIGAINDRRGDGTVIGLGHSGREYGPASTDAARQWSGWGTALKPAIEPIILARKTLDGTVAANVLAHGVGGLNIDGCRVEAHDSQLAEKYASVQNAPARANSIYGKDARDRAGSAPHDAGRFPANVLLDEHAAKEMDEQSGVLKTGSHMTHHVFNGSENASMSGRNYTRSPKVNSPANEGGASRFFPVFKYQAKAPKKERPVIVREDGTKVQHPTVKPVALMEWLVTLITPDGGTTLDPFAGTGTTLQAARDKGFNAIGIEQDADYIQLIGERLGWSAA